MSINEQVRITYPAPRPFLLRTGEVTSAATGDDGYYEMGFVWPGTRWVENGDGTVTDHATGLMWAADAVKIARTLTAGEIGVGLSAPTNNQLQRADGVYASAATDFEFIVGSLVSHSADGYNYWWCGLAHTKSAGATPGISSVIWIPTDWTGSAANLTTGAGMAWVTALANCVALDYAGYTDWRMPNYLEFVSLINFENRAVPSAIVLPIINVWTSTTTGGSASAFYANGVLATGVIRDLRLTAKSTDTFGVMPVRGGYKL